MTPSGINLHRPLRAFKLGHGQQEANHEKMGAKDIPSQRTNVTVSCTGVEKEVNVAEVQ